MDKLNLPEGISVLETQVAGHTFQTNTETLGLLKHNKSAFIFKPLGKPACGERELGFYKNLQISDDRVMRQLSTLVPKFYNKLKLMVNQHEHTFLKLEDLTRGMTKPCIMDIKIGRRTWDPLATPQKRAAEEQKYVQCKQFLGLCVPGLQVYPANGDDIIRFNKDYGKRLDVEGFRATIELFLNVKGTACKPFIREILKQLYSIRDWFRVQRRYHFYASSLLIVYDMERLKEYLAKAKPNGLCINDNAQIQIENEIRELEAQLDCTCIKIAEPLTLEPASWIKVRMIDFAHVFDSENGSLDTNYLFGLQNLISVIEDLLMR